MELFTVGSLDCLHARNEGTSICVFSNLDRSLLRHQPKACTASPLKRKEKKGKDYTFRRQLMRSQVLYRAAQPLPSKLYPCDQHISSLMYANILLVCMSTVHALPCLQVNYNSYDVLTSIVCACFFLAAEHQPNCYKQQRVYQITTCVPWNVKNSLKFPAQVLFCFSLKFSNQN